jgi:hypothetical protein
MANDRGSEGEGSSGKGRVPVSNVVSQCVPQTRWQFGVLLF